ncbi:MAG: glycosyltransferase family 4 protein [Candidatus Electrothrix sp. ATG1]|nr:glycosyltransferase family 4 protein [Candidatus Electrothrix sp. ATG1]
MGNVIGLLVGVFLSAFMLTGVMRRYAIAKNIFDIPNRRSSHMLATPRGGGAAIVVSFLTGVFFVWLSGKIEKNFVIAVTGSGMLVAGIGFWDDHRHIKHQWRLSVHFVAACWSLLWLGGTTPQALHGFFIHAGWLGIGVVVFFMVWLLNLFNFMDGIDGIAGSEALFVSIGGAFLSFSAGSRSQALVLSILAAATLGFLIWNWPPAKIFMGDVGSGFLGMMLGVLSYAGTADGSVCIWSWLILFSIFIVDATVTLLRRMLHGEIWYEAHCNHTYQRAAKKYSHLKVTVSVNFINTLWLFPCAWYAYSNPEWGIVLMIVAYTPLLILAFLMEPANK